MSIRPSSPPKPVRLAFEVDVSGDFISGFIEERGVRPPKRWAIEFNLETVEPHLRGLLLNAYERYLEVEPYPQVAEPTDEPEAFLSTLLPWLDSAEKLEEQELASQEEESRLEAETHERFMEEMRGWSEIFGSKRLKAALAGGYKANTTYALERAAMEIPGFWVDTASDMDWAERSDPSLEALELEGAAKAQFSALNELETAIVWLKEAPRSLVRALEGDDLEFDPQETLIGLGYLGRYAVALPVDEALHRNQEVVA